MFKVGNVVVYTGEPRRGLETGKIYTVLECLSRNRYDINLEARCYALEKDLKYSFKYYSELCK